MTILITGGAGLIGSNLLKLLLKHNYFCVVIDDLSSGNKSNIPNDENLIFYQSSISDQRILEKIFSAHDIESVFHLAAFFANQNSVEHPEKDLHVNGMGTILLLEKCLQYKVKKFIYTSSSCVYGSLSDMREDSELPIGNLDTPYAITKLLGEQYCRYYAKQHGLNTVCARLFNSYGPGELPGKYRNVIPNFFYRAIKKEPLIITGTGEETRDFTFVEDTVMGLIAMLDNDTQPGDVFNLGSGFATSILTLAQKINEISSNCYPIVFQERRCWDEITHRISNIEKAKKVLKYCPKYNLNEGLYSTYSWLKQQTV